MNALYPLHLAALLGIYILLGSTSVHGATTITGVSIYSVSNEYVGAPWDLRAIHVVDGSGLSGDSLLHAQLNTSTNNSWQTSTGGGTANIEFDLGAVYDLEDLHIWNLNFYSPYNGRGAKSVNIYTSLDATNWTLEENREFSMASGLDGDTGFHVNALNWADARYVQFDILSNWGGFDNAGHVGLSEVRFFGNAVPEPARVLLLLSGLAGTMLRRRRL